MNSDLPNRRLSDQRWHRRVRVRTQRICLWVLRAAVGVRDFARTYSKDVWQFIVTILVMLALLLFATQQQDVKDAAKDSETAGRDAKRAALVAQSAADQAKAIADTADQAAEDNCERAKVLIPITLKILVNARKTGVISRAEIETYREQLPSNC